MRSVIPSIALRLSSKVRDYFNARPFLFAVFLLGIVMNFGFFLFMSGQVWISTISTLAPDSIQYMKIAGGILGNNSPNEFGLMIFGPGFGAYLAVIMFLFGSHEAILLFFQHLLAAANLLILYEVAREISKSHKIGIIAAALYATSFTAIALANLILSDVLFFCLYLFSVLFLLKSLKRFRWQLVILSGFVLGAAILVKSIGQFLIVGLLLLPLLYIKEMSPAAEWKGRFHWYGRYAVAPLIALVIIGGWMTRNYVVHDKAMLAFTGAGGPSNIALRAIAKEENREAGDVYAEWVETYKARTGLTELSLSDDYDMRTHEVRKAIGKYPGAMMSVYFGLTWENLTATNELYFTQCPTYKYDIDSGVLWYKAHSLNFLSFWLSICGLALMILLRRWRLFFFTAGLFVYFAGLIGFTQFQGSRLFFPGQVACFISIGFLIESLISSKEKPA
ncbi:MAG: glycosyltransferase family 39 protein [Candidatus Zixiibacteriota bacterium]